MEKVKTIALFQPSSSFSSGSTQSAVQLALDLNALGYNCFMILYRKGNLEKILKEKNIEYYIVKDHCDDVWTKSIHNQTNPIFTIPKKLFKKILNIFYTLKASRLCKKKGVDLIHVNTITCCQGAVVANRLNVPLVWHIREFMEEDLQIEFCDKKKACNLLKSADCFIAISEAIKNKHLKLLGGAPIVTIYNGVDCHKYYKEREIFVGEKITISITGRITQKKGQHELIKAIGLLPQKEKELLSINIVGRFENNSYKEYLMKLVEENGLNEIVNFVDFTESVQNVLWQSDILCVCSAKEAFGRTTVEGMQAGCLVIGSSSGGTVELINNGTTGYLYHPGDCSDLSHIIVHVLHDINESRIVAKNGQKQAIQMFNNERNSREISNLYENIFNSKRKS